MQFFPTAPTHAVTLSPTCKVRQCRWPVVRNAVSSPSALTSLVRLSPQTSTDAYFQLQVSDWVPTVQLCSCMSAPFPRHLACGLMQCNVRKWREEVAKGTVQRGSWSSAYPINPAGKITLSRGMPDRRWFGPMHAGGKQLGWAA